MAEDRQLNYPGGESGSERGKGDTMGEDPRAHFPEKNNISYSMHCVTSG